MCLSTCTFNLHLGACVLCDSYCVIVIIDMPVSCVISIFDMPITCVIAITTICLSLVWQASRRNSYALAALTLLFETWLIELRDMTCAYVSHHLRYLTCVTLDMTLYTWGVSRFSDMTHSDMFDKTQGDASFIRVTWLILKSTMTPAYVWHDSLYLHMWPDSLQLSYAKYVWHDSLSCVTWMCRVTQDQFTHETWLLLMWDMIHLYPYNPHRKSRRDRIENTYKPQEE